MVGDTSASCCCCCCCFLSLSVLSEPRFAEERWYLFTCFRSHHPLLPSSDANRTVVRARICELRAELGGQDEDREKGREKAGTPTSGKRDGTEAPGFGTSGDAPLAAPILRTASHRLGNCAQRTEDGEQSKHTGNKNSWKWENIYRDGGPANARSGGRAGGVPADMW
ncbi:hypothetical protein BHE74_00042152 [Ensete ventricosum]|nr:hypothetical protein BHE74_00042152 [Ensete ventricosum]